jgi:uncharacterized SAM-binding protein YcdF (DUF218 family)
MNLVATRWWSTLLLPSGLLLLGLAVGLLLVVIAWRQGRRPAQSRLACLLTGASALLLYLASTPLVATWLARGIESEHPPVDPATLPEADAIVVLGGGMHASRAPDGHVRLYMHHACDRFEVAMEAWAAGRAALMAFGGGGTGVEGTPSEGEWNRARAVARGVPPESALSGPAARYTTDESEGIAAELRARGVRRVIVCTSAMHMPRALRNYRNRGFEAVALPADFSTRGTAEAFSPALLIPRGLALALTDSWAKERLGMLATPEDQAGATESAEPSSR